MYVGGGFGRDAKESLEEFWFRARELEIAAEQRAPRCTRTVALPRERKQAGKSRGRRRRLRSQCLPHTAGEQLMEKTE